MFQKQTKTQQKIIFFSFFSFCLLVIQCILLLRKTILSIYAYMCVSVCVRMRISFVFRESFFDFFSS